MNVMVLGGGVIGITTAWFLARDGHDVTVVEREPEVALGTSYGNAGLIHTSLVEPWNEPGVLWKLLKWLGRDNAPAVLRPSAIPQLFGWGLSFLRNATSERHRQHALVNLRLAVLSAATLKEVREETGIAYDHGEAGILKIERNQAALDLGIGQANWLREHGHLPFRVLDRAAVLELEPALMDIADQVQGGILFSGEESGDCRIFTQRLAETIEQRGGSLRTGTTIERIEVEGDRVAGVVTQQGKLSADVYVLALGWSSPEFGRPLGIHLPIAPVKGYSITLPTDGWNASPKVPVLDEALKVAVTPLGARLRIAGSAEFTGPDLNLNRQRSDYVWQTALELYPALARHADPEQVERWTGLRPMTPDGPPILGATQYRNLFVNAGHGHLGWTFACGSAQVVAELVAGRRSPIALDGLTADRFA